MPDKVQDPVNHQKTNLPVKELPGIPGVGGRIGDRDDHIPKRQGIQHWN